MLRIDRSCQEFPELTRALLGIVFLAAAVSAPALAHDTTNAADGQLGHQHLMMEGAKRSIANYAIPQIQLVRADGKAVSLADEINDGRPVVLDFIYTTCTSICPISSQTLADLQKKLGAASDRVHLLSISIDPENDTPARLSAYAQKFGAGPAWQFYTGTAAASNAAQRAFDAYRGDKMSHLAVTLVRTGPEQRWIRLDGFATAEQLFAELKETTALRSGSPAAIASHTPVLPSTAN